jgi:hypothetical protein
MKQTDLGGGARRLRQLVVKVLIFWVPSPDNQQRRNVLGIIAISLVLANPKVPDSN